MERRVSGGKKQRAKDRAHKALMLTLWTNGRFVRQRSQMRVMIKELIESDGSMYVVLQACEGKLVDVAKDNDFEHVGKGRI
jgi:hypothetical protein